MLNIKKIYLVIHDISSLYIKIDKKYFTVCRSNDNTQYVQK